MPIDARTKIDLVKSDPYLGHSLNGGPLPDDDYLTFQLGSDYREYLKLRRDGHITSQLLKRKMAILARRVIVEPVGENKPEKQAAEVAERLLDRVRYESFCNALLEDGPLAGFSVVKLDYDKDDENLIYPSWEVVPQTRCSTPYGIRGSAGRPSKPLLEAIPQQVIQAPYLNWL